jgi:ribonuclease BN (tRNA processing enzyme)
MKLTVTGCAASYSRTPGLASSSYLVEHGSTRVVLDLGQGSFAEAWRHTDFADVAAVFISHMHADHNVDLIALRQWTRFANRGYGPALYGPPELRQRMGEFQNDPDFLSDLHGEPLSPRTFAVGDLAITAGRVTHMPNAYGFRVAPADGSTPGLVYSGDTSRADDLLPLTKPGDTLLCEAAFGAGKQAAPIHLTAEQAARAAARASAARLVLTHLFDGVNAKDAAGAAARVFEGDVAIAQPGLKVAIR